MGVVQFGEVLGCLIHPNMTAPWTHESSEELGNPYWGFARLSGT